MGYCMSPNCIGDGSVTARLSYVIPENALGDIRSKNGRLGTSPRFLQEYLEKQSYVLVKHTCQSGEENVSQQSKFENPLHCLNYLL